MCQIEKLYGAHMRFPKVAGDIVFQYSEIEIVKTYPDMVEAKYPYFTSMHHSTRYFEKGMLNREYEITDELKVFYSDDKEKCIEWLTKLRKELLDSCRYNFQRLEKSEIVEKESEDLE